MFDDAVLVAFGVAQNTRIVNRVLDALASLNIIILDDVTGKATITLEQTDFKVRKREIVEAVSKIQGADAAQMLNYLENCFGVSRVTRKDNKPVEKLTINRSQYAKFKTLWENLNREAVLTYELDTPTLIDKIIAKINQEFAVLPLSISITTTRHVENTDKTHSTTSVYNATPHSLYSLAEFVRDLANGTKLSYATVAEIIQQMSPDKFALIADNENRALAALKDICLSSIYELIINKVSYEIREIRVKTSLTDNTGALLDSIPLSVCGKEKYDIEEPTVRDNSLFKEAYLPVDSDIERKTVEESNIDTITVFTKLPKINIPTPIGNYNPDFGYVVKHGDNQCLYLVVETKGYDSKSEIGTAEGFKIKSAARFFEALEKKGVNVVYKTKLNEDSLKSIIGASLQI